MDVLYVFVGYIAIHPSIWQRSTKKSLSTWWLQRYNDSAEETSSPHVEKRRKVQRNRKTHRYFRLNYQPLGQDALPRRHWQRLWTPHQYAKEKDNADKWRRKIASDLKKANSDKQEENAVGNAPKGLQRQLLTRQGWRACQEWLFPMVLHSIHSMKGRKASWLWEATIVGSYHREGEWRRSLIVGINWGVPLWG